MGAGTSKDEALYQAVQSSNHQAVKKLRRDGANLEWEDKEGRTPLILACTRGDLYDMVITLLNEGANHNVYRHGPHGGYPLHHAAKRGLDKTVLLLLSRGANPLALNDDNMTPLDMARNKSHLTVVRILEERICLFSGTLRELSGPSFLEYVAPQMVTKKIWVVVLPTEADPRRPSRYEVVIYQSSKVAVPRTVISLAKAEVDEPKFHHRDPHLVITAADKSAKVKFKILSENEGDKDQLERFYKACLGIRQSEGGVPSMPTTLPAQGLQPVTRAPPPHTSSTVTPPNPSTSLTSQPNPPPSVSSTPSVPKPKPSNSSPAPASESISDDMALEWAIKNSIISASEEGVPVSPSARQPAKWDNRWGPSDGKKGENAYAGWADGEQSGYGGWDSGSSAGVGPSRLGPSAAENPSSFESKPGSTKSSPSPPQSTDTLTAGLNLDPGQSVTLSASSSSPPAPSAPPLPLDRPLDGVYGVYPSISSINTSRAEVPFEQLPKKSDGSVPFEQLPKKSDGSAAEEDRDEKAGGQCVVCWDKPAEGVSIPCGHLAGCMDCLKEIQSKKWGCPVCRAPIDQVLKVYAV